jgi:phosphonate transport system substrate-binding protein
MHKDPVGQRVLEAAANSIQTKTPISFIAASDADYAAYRDFYRRAPASLH